MSTANGTPLRHRSRALLVLLLLLGLPVMVDSHAIQSRLPLTVVFALDVSDSMDNMDRATSYITDTVQYHLHQHPAERDVQQGLVVFGKTSAVELAPARNFPFDSVKSQVDRGATDVERALGQCSELIPADVQGRIVLVSDGVQTEGHVSHAFNELKSRGIAVDVLPMDYSYTNEVWLEQLDLPPQMKPGETCNAGVVLAALNDGKGMLSLRRDGGVIAEQEVDYKAGKNRFEIPITVGSSGCCEYMATIEVPKAQDSLAQNNSVVADRFVGGEGRVLLATDSIGDRRDSERLERAIRECGRAVEVIAGTDMPRDAESLIRYDAIVFCNVPRYEFDAQQLQAVRDAVHNLGAGFLMVGGSHSFGPGGYDQTVIEEILPVSTDIAQGKDQPAGALVIILDPSHIPEGTTWAKRLTKMTIKALQSNDQVGVIASTEKGATWLVEMTSPTKYEELVPIINGAEMRRVSSFHNTMKMGYERLKSSNAAKRHMIILSDGSPEKPSPKLVQDFIDAEISVSVVTAFPHGGVDASKMQSVAEVTGGRYYFPDEPNHLSEIFVREAKTLRPNLLQNKVFTPTIGFPSPVVEGLDGMPELKGYVFTTSKGESVQQILNGPRVAAQSNSFVPILSIWQHGLGRAAAFTSDLGPNWGADWQKWDLFPQFVKQLMSDICRATHMRLSTHASGGEAIITVEDEHPHGSTLQVQATLSGPNEKSENIELQQIASQTYRATVPLWEHGRYHVTVRGIGDNRRELAAGAFGAIVAYTPEYLQFRSNRQALREIAAQTGGQVLIGDPVQDSVYARGRTFKSTPQSSFDWFLIALALLIPIDAAIRRLWVEFSTVWITASHPPQAPATQTIMALMKTKRWVDAALSTKGTTKLLIRIWSPAPRSSWPKPATAKPLVASESSAANDESSTTEKRLALKPKRDEKK